MKLKKKNQTQNQVSKQKTQKNQNSKKEQLTISETFWNWILAYKHKQVLFSTWLGAVELKILCDLTKNGSFVRKNWLI